MGKVKSIIEKKVLDELVKQCSIREYISLTDLLPKIEQAALRCYWVAKINNIDEVIANIEAALLNGRYFDNKTDLCRAIYITPKTLESWKGCRIEIKKKRVKHDVLQVYEQKYDLTDLKKQILKYKKVRIEYTQ